MSETSKNALIVELDKLSKEVSRLKLENQNERNQLNQSNYLHDIEKVVQVISSYELGANDLDDIQHQYSSQKVTAAINKMNTLYSTYKDELRAKKSLESKCKELNQELEKCTSIIETSKRELIEYKNTISGLESDLSSKSKELNQYVHSNKSLQDLVNNYSKREEELKLTYEAERKARSKQLVDYQLMDNDLTRFRIESDGNRSTINKLQDQVSSYKTKLAEETSTNENYLNQIRLLKSNNTKLTSTLQQMEKGLELDKKEMEALDKKLSDADSNINMINKLKLQIGILENDLLHQKEENKILLADKSEMIRSNNDITVEIELLKRKISLNESKIATLQGDNTSLNQELTEQKAKFNDSIKAFSTTKHTASGSGTNANVLSEKIKSLERSIEEKNELLSTEINARMRYEQDIVKLKAMIERANRELILSTEKSTALRNEGRKGRKVVQELISYVKEHAQCSHYGKPSSTELHNKSQQLKGLIADGNTDGNSSDTLGIAELTNLILSLQVTTSKPVSNNESVKEITINSKPVTDLALEELYKLQEQKIHLEHALNSARNDCERMGSEVSKLKTVTNEYMKSLDKEKHEKDTIKSALDLLNMKYDELLREKASKEHNQASALDLASIKLSTASSSETIQAISAATNDEINQLKTRNSVLCDTIEKLENKLLLKYDPPKEVTNSLDEISHNRLRAKISAMEDLIHTYRNSILSLSRNIATKHDGMSIFTSTTEIVDSDLQNLDGGYVIEHEIASMKRSYQEEVALLEDEITNLKTKLNANNSYVNEIRSRFEENIKQLYVPGKNVVIDTLTKELSDLNIALESAEKTIQHLHNQIALEREAARRKHDSYMDHLFKVINTRDSAISTIKQLEKLMHQSGMEHKAEYIALHNEFTSVLKASTRMRNEYNEQKRAIDGLMKGLIENDHELHEAERRANRQQNRQQITRRSFSGTAAVTTDHDRVTLDKDKKNNTSPFVVRSTHNFPKK
jgi:chromosome segregation ATPase